MPSMTQRLFVVAALLAACRSETRAPAARRAATSPAAAPATAPATTATPAPAPGPPPAPPHITLASSIPVVEELPQGRWRVTVDLTLQNSTPAPLSFSLSELRAALSLGDAGSSPALTPTLDSTLRAAPMAPQTALEGRLVFECAAQAGPSELTLRWAPAGHEPSEARHPLMVTPGIHPIPLPAPSEAAAPAPDAAASP
ncbi:MAG: hypothetical protein R3A48_20005 [Polyangiales bacterium]